MSETERHVVEIRSSHVFYARDKAVLLDAKVAEAFGVETRVVNQAVARNQEKFRDETHAFQLTSDETEFLRSQSVIPSFGHGGSRTFPWVYTQKGVARLASVLKSPKALQALDLIIDIFIEVYHQASQGQQQVAISNPSRLTPAPTEANAVQKIRSQLLKAVDGLLEIKINPKTQSTVRDELSDLGSGAWKNLKNRLENKGLENEKLAAETVKILEEVRVLRERSQVEIEKIQLDNLDKRISIVERSLNLAKQLEPDAMVDLLGNFAPVGLPDAHKQQILIENISLKDDGSKVNHKSSKRKKSKNIKRDKSKG